MESWVLRCGAGDPQEPAHSGGPVGFGSCPVAPEEALHSALISSVGPLVVVLGADFRLRPRLANLLLGASLAREDLLIVAATASATSPVRTVAASCSGGRPDAEELARILEEQDRLLGRCGPSRVRVVDLRRLHEETLRARRCVLRPRLPWKCWVPRSDSNLSDPALAVIPTMDCPTVETVVRALGTPRATLLRKRRESGASTIGTLLGAYLRACVREQRRRGRTEPEIAFALGRDARTVRALVRGGPGRKRDRDAKDEGRRTKDEGRRTKDEGRRTKDEGRRTNSSPG